MYEFTNKQIIDELLVVAIPSIILIYRQILTFSNSSFFVVVLYDVSYQIQLANSIESFAYNIFLFIIISDHIVTLTYDG